MTARLTTQGFCSETYLDGAFGTHNHGFVGQQEARRAGEHGQPVPGELEGDDDSFIRSCNSRHQTLFDAPVIAWF